MNHPSLVLASAVSTALVLAGCTLPEVQPLAAPPAASLVSESFERDRMAILGMAGEFDVTFDFTETEALRKGYQLRPPKRSHGTELVEVIEDSGRSIVLQHILVLGEEHEVVKHWRQDWTYEDGDVWAFRGRGLWERERHPLAEVRGRWSQAVYEVDDGPRYESIGRWEHEPGRSAWTSGETWRPLPRREYTQRSDYDVIVALNRHVVTPLGWLHEQDNSKLELDDSSGAPLLAREMGRNTYRRIADYDFSAGREYWRRTQAFWADVRQEWNVRMQVTDRLVVHLPPDGERLYNALLPLAESSGLLMDADRRKLAIRRTIGGFVTTPQRVGTASNEGIR